MLTISLDGTIEQRLNWLTRTTHKTIEQVIDASLALYAEQQEDVECLAIIAERKDEPLVSYADVRERLKADGLI
jgi:uncharacterized protein YllA (UPF0747 family)